MSLESSVSHVSDKAITVKLCLSQDK